MLNILEQNDLRAMGHNTADSIHAIAEAMKLGFCRPKHRFLGDPDFVSVDTERLTSKAYAAKRFRLIGGHAGEYAPAEGIEAKEYPGNTSHFFYNGSFLVMQFLRRRPYGTGLEAELQWRDWGLY